MNKQKTKAFTLVELIVVITILAILGTIAFISLQGYSATSRDSVRISDVSNMKTSLELFHLDAGKYPLPDNRAEVQYSGDILWYQGVLGESVVSQLSRNLNEIPTDPLSGKTYVFSTSGNKNEFEILNLLEGEIALNIFPKTNAASNTRISKVQGQYNGLFIKTANYIVPTPSIITSETLSGILILDGANIKSQIIDGGTNIPKIGNVTQVTKDLDIELSVYSGPTITSESSEAQKIALIDKIKEAYSGSILSSTDIYKTLLDSTTNDELVTFVDTVILNTSSSVAPIVISDADCSSGTSNSYTHGIISHTQTGGVTKIIGDGTELTPYGFNSAIVTCNNGIISISSEITDLYESCNSILTNVSSQSGVDGVYTIDPESNLTGFKVYCDMTTNGGGWILVGKSRNNVSESLFNVNQIGNIFNISMDTTAKLSDIKINSILNNSQENLVYAQNTDISNYFVFIKLLNNTWTSVGVMTQMKYSNNISGPWSPEGATYQASGQVNGGPTTTIHTGCAANEYNGGANYRVLINGSCIGGYGGEQSFNWAHNSYTPPTLAGSAVDSISNDRNSLWYIK